MIPTDTVSQERPRTRAEWTARRRTARRRAGVRFLVGELIGGTVLAAVLLRMDHVGTVWASPWVLALFLVGLGSCVGVPLGLALADAWLVRAEDLEPAVVTEADRACWRRSPQAVALEAAWAATNVPLLRSDARVLTATAAREAAAST